MLLAVFTLTQMTHLLTIESAQSILIVRLTTISPSLTPNQSFNNNLIRNGKTIAPVLFTQDYFEHDLGWDFTTIWQWNDERNEPELRATESQSSSQNLSMNTGSLLAQQLQANIWL